MMRRYNRLLVAFYVVSDALLGMAAFVARLPAPLRDSRPAARHQGHPAVRAVPAHRCRSSALLVPLAFQVQGLYRLRRGRSRVDDFFAVFVGSILAVVLGLGGTLYVQTYYVPGRAEGRRRSTRSRSCVWALFLVLNVVVHLRARASSCARRSSAAGAPASASSAS